jgi:hypothetical protein
MEYETEAVCEHLLPPFDVFVGRHKTSVVMIAFTVLLSLCQGCGV